MLITIPTEMSVTEMFNLDRFGEFRVSSEGGRLEQFTQNERAGRGGLRPAPARISRCATMVIDDGQNSPEPGSDPDPGWKRRLC